MVSTAKLRYLVPMKELPLPVSRPLMFFSLSCHWLKECDTMILYCLNSVHVFGNLQFDSSQNRPKGRFKYVHQNRHFYLTVKAHCEGGTILEGLSGI